MLRALGYLEYIHNFSADELLTQFGEYIKQVTSDFEFKFIPTNQTREYTAGVVEYVLLGASAMFGPDVKHKNCERLDEN